MARCQVGMAHGLLPLACSPSKAQTRSSSSSVLTRSSRGQPQPLGARVLGQGPEQDSTVSKSVRRGGQRRVPDCQGWSSSPITEELRDLDKSLNPPLVKGMLSLLHSSQSWAQSKCLAVSLLWGRVVTWLAQDARPALSSHLSTATWAPLCFSGIVLKR